MPLFFPYLGGGFSFYVMTAVQEAVGAPEGVETATTAVEAAGVAVEAATELATSVTLRWSMVKEDSLTERGGRAKARRVCCG